MEKREILTPIVKSPARDAHLRKGSGFSLSEIKSAGYDLQIIKDLNIEIDYRRKSVYDKNIELLKSLKIPDRKGTKREPFIAKEKKRTEFKSKTAKPKKKTPMKVKKVESKEKISKPVKPKEKIGMKEVNLSKGMISLTELQGLGPTTAKKLNELGVTSIEDLIKESPEELAPLIKGCSEDRLKKWIEEAKELAVK